MKENELKDLFSKFIQTIDANEVDSKWQVQSQKFRSLWENKIVLGDPGNLTDEEIDEIVRILDRSGKGNTKKNAVAIAQVMIAQGAWRRIFHAICLDKSLSKLVSMIFTDDNLIKKGELIDKMYLEYKKKIKYIAGKSGNFINTMLAAYDPFQNLSVISLKDRMMLIKYFDFPIPKNFELESWGYQFIESNRIIMECFKEAGIAYSARTLSRFCYSENVQPIWKGEFTVKREGKDVTVTVPVDKEKEDEIEDLPEEIEEQRESIKIQALVSRIGSEMGFKIWLPRSDRARVLLTGQLDQGCLLETLPLNYNNTTMKTIENIDVLWLKGSSIVRAFEVEHTTSIYSGILRMADLLALLPNINIKLHIVAPTARRDKVFEEIQRPVFSLLESGPMAEKCTYISYDSIRELSEEKHLQAMKDIVLDDFVENAEEI